MFKTDRLVLSLNSRPGSHEEVEEDEEEPGFLVFTRKWAGAVHCTGVFAPLFGVCCSLHGCVLFTARVGGVHRTGVHVSLFGSVLFTARVRFVHDVGVRCALRLRYVPIGEMLNFRTSTSQKCKAVPKRARI